MIFTYVINGDYLLIPLTNRSNVDASNEIGSRKLTLYGLVYRDSRTISRARRTLFLLRKSVDSNRKIFYVY